MCEGKFRMEPILFSTSLMVPRRPPQSQMQGRSPILTFKFHILSYGHRTAFCSRLMMMFTRKTTFMKASLTISLTPLTAHIASSQPLVKPAIAR